MKQDLKTRFSLRAFFATLLRPFMSKSPTDVPGLFSSGESRIDVTAWQTLIMSNPLSIQCGLKRAVYYKCDNHKQHEFLHLYFRHWNSSESAVAAVVIERIPKQDPRNNSSSSRLIHTSNLISPSASETVAEDVVHTSRQGSAFPQYLVDAYAPFTELCTLDFSPLACPSAAQISILLSAVNQHAPHYHLYDNQCYWFSFTVWETLKKLFPDCTETHSAPVDKRSHYCGFAVRKADSVEDVCRDYDARWRDIENEAELKRKADEANKQQLLAEGYTQGLAQGLAGQDQIKAELEAERVRAEAERVQAEVEHIRMQTEINELRARLAALGESTR
jgi:hypothetical protein